MISTIAAASSALHVVADQTLTVDFKSRLKTSIAVLSAAQTSTPTQLRAVPPSLPASSTAQIIGTNQTHSKIEVNEGESKFSEHEQAL